MPPHIDCHSDNFTQYLFDENDAAEKYVDEQISMLKHVVSFMGTAASFAANSYRRKRKHDETSSGTTNRGRKPGANTIKRQRLNIEEYIRTMPAREFRRRYRMDKASFYNLLDVISPHLPSNGSVRKRGATPNGIITHKARLSMALRYCAGGDPLDISHIHGVHSDEVLNSLWNVVDAVHKSPALDIKFQQPIL